MLTEKKIGQKRRNKGLKRIRLRSRLAAHEPGIDQTDAKDFAKSMLPPEPVPMEKPKEQRSWARSMFDKARNVLRTHRG